MTAAARVKGARNPRPAPAVGAASSGPAGADAPGASLSHNLAGQRLGRKGRDTRERILAAAAELIESGPVDQLSLSAVARGASLGLTSVYNYFADLTELLLALLEPVMASAETSYLALLRQRWPDDEIAARCEAFVLAYHQFWARHSRLLHLRNSMADMLDARMMQHRVEATQPIIALLVAQMDAETAAANSRSAAFGLATMVMIGIERSVTIVTDRRLHDVLGWGAGDDEGRYVQPGVRLMELAVRDMRAANAR